MRADEGDGVPGNEAVTGDTFAQSRTDDANGRDESRPAASAHQIEGSHSSDDPDRPLWDRSTSLIAEYAYHDEHGRPLFTIYKGERGDGKKAFLTGRPFIGNMGELDLARRDDPHGFYCWTGLTNVMKGKGGERDVLYRLPELMAAMGERPNDFVFVCEGEKDVESLLALGLIATTNPNGALRWPSEFNRHFHRRRVVILVDNDNRGRQRAARIAPGLRRYAALVVALELPGLPEHGDVTDWLSEERTKDDLLAAVESALERGAGTIVEEDDANLPQTVPGEFAPNAHGFPAASLRNARIALNRLGVVLRFDEFGNRYLIDGLPGFGPILDDAALTRMRHTLEREWRLKYAKDRWFDIATDEARHRTFHPVREFLNSREWDGRARLDAWLCSYGGAADSEYVRAVGAIILIAAVRRVRQPGCKFDEMPVLESDQGTNKSSALAILAINEEWFTDDCPLNADSKVLIEQLTGRWIVEMGELKGMRRGEVESVKAMLSRRVDKARLAYGRMPVEQPRQCVFFGTTNDSAYLRDMTGNRRFWPVKVKRFDLDALRRDRDQLWAEAAAREAQGESIRLPERLWAEAGAQQASREVSDPIYDTLAERLDGWVGKVRASDIWEAIGLGDTGRRTQDHNVRLSAAMQKLGWRRPKSKLRFDGRPQHAWVKGPDGDHTDAFEPVPRSIVLNLDEEKQDRRPM